MNLAHRAKGVRWLGLSLLLTLALVVAGCGSGGRGTVSGKVSYQGKPLTGGLVTFNNPGGVAKVVTAEIQGDGSYKATNVPAEKTGIEITNDTLPDGVMSYPDYEVKRGEQTLNIELK
jgi:hypothetical protein